MMSRISKKSTNTNGPNGRKERKEKMNETERYEMVARHLLEKEKPAGLRKLALNDLLKNSKLDCSMQKYGFEGFHRRVIAEVAEHDPEYATALNGALDDVLKLADKLETDAKRKKEKVEREKIAKADGAKKFIKEDSRMLKVKETFDKMESEIDDFRDLFGEVVYDAFNEDDNSSYEIGRSIVRELRNASALQFDFADKMLIAITGYSLESHLERIKDRIKEREEA